jgi:hypothetical protein
MAAALVAVAAVAGPAGIAPAAGPAIRPTAERYRALMDAQRPLVRVASLIKTAVEENGYPGYASLVIESGRVALYYKGAVPGGLHAVIARARASAPVRVLAAAYSEAELMAAARTIAARIGPGAPIQSVKLAPDGSGLLLAVPKRGATGILAADSARSAGVLAWAPKVGVPTTVVYQAPIRQLSRTDDRSPWSGGAVVVNSTLGSTCTAGFGVNSDAGPAILTAAHCGRVGDRFQDGTGELIGTMGPRNAADDVALIPTSSVSNRVYSGSQISNNSQTVTGFADSFIGELVCQSGYTTAAVFDGPLCGLEVRFFSLSPGVATEATQIDGITPARDGDSGGPVYSDQGLTVVAKGTASFGAGLTFFYHAFGQANRDFGATIPPAAGSGVVFFRDVRFGGPMSQALAPGSYTLSMLEARGFLNDWASSARVPAGRTVTMFEHDGFVGTQWTLRSDTPDFRFLQPNANDIVSSVIIR